MQLQFTLAIYCKVRHMLQNLQTPQSIAPLRLSMTMDKASAICSTSCQMLLGASEISIIRAHTAPYAITFLPPGSFLLQLYSAFDDDLQGICSCSTAQGRRTRKICGDSVFYSHKIKSLASHRSHKSHKAHLLTLVFAIRLQTLGRADKRGRSDAQFVRFVRSV